MRLRVCYSVVKYNTMCVTVCYYGYVTLQCVTICWSVLPCSGVIVQKSAKSAAKLMLQKWMIMQQLNSQYCDFYMSPNSCDFDELHTFVATFFCPNLCIFLQHFWDWKAESANVFDVWLKGWCRSSGWVTLIFIPVHSGEIFSDPRKQANPVVVDLERKMTRRWLYSWNNINQLAKLGDAIAISNLKLSMTHSLTHCTDPLHWLTGVGARRCYRLGISFRVSIEHLLFII